MSGEHLWSEWIHKLVPKTKKFHIQETRPQWISLNAPNLPPYRLIRREGDPVTKRLKVVCERHCNNGWMSRLEEEAKPCLTKLIKGEMASLNPQEQDGVAAWAAMKIIVAEFSAPES